MNYKEINAINQSSLKEILKSPRAYQNAINKTEESEEKHFVLGSLLDAMLLESPEYIEENYCVMSEGSASDAIKQIVLYAYEQTKLISEEDILLVSFNSIYDLVVKGCRIYGWNSKWGPDALFKNVKSGGGEEYFEALKIAGNRQIVSQVDYAQAITAKMAVIGDPYISQLFSEKEQTILKKVIISFIHKDFPCKGELDMIVVNHKKKTIIPLDIKSMSSPSEYFPINFWKFRYDFQAVFYEIGLKSHPEVQKWVNQGYAMKNFMFIAVDITGASVPLVYTINDEVRNIAINGGQLSSGKLLEGIEQAFERLSYHINEADFNYPMEYSKGPLNIKI